MRRSFLDLAMLETRHGDDRFYAAGVPWYVALFGRDSIITALETLAFAPEVGRATLDLLARYQGRENNPERDEEPGKILHELRVGERARLGEVPFTPYYGSVDATPLFLILLGEYLQWTGDLDCFTALRPQVDAALAGWSARGTPMATASSSTSLEPATVSSTRAGRTATTPSSTRTAHLPTADRAGRDAGLRLPGVPGHGQRLPRAGEGDRAARLERRPTQIQETFERSFWSPELGNYALAAARGARGEARRGRRRLQPGPGPVGRHRRRGATQEPCATVSWTRTGSTPAGGCARSSQAAAAYNPFDYQTGAVWPHDSAMVARGSALLRLRRRGARDPHRASTRRPPGSTSTGSPSSSPASTGRPMAGPCGIRWRAVPRPGRREPPYPLTAVLGLVPDASPARCASSAPGCPSGSTG